MDASIIVTTLQNKENFFICSHVQPDGDALGSSLGLARILQDRGKKVTLLGNENDYVPKKYKFLPGSNQFTSKTDNLPVDAMLVLDCASTHRLGDFAKLIEKVPLVINIDHHPDNSLFGNINYVDKNVSSVSEIIFELAKQSNLNISYQAALCLYVGIVTDTGRFQYSNTSSQSFRVAAELVELGVAPNLVFNKIYEDNSLGWCEIMGKGLERATYLAEFSLIYSYLTKEDFSQAKAKLSDAENLVEWLRSVNQAKFAVVLKETFDNKVKVSLRSKNKINVGKIAGLLGGGGHTNASGYTSDLNITESLEKLKSVLRNHQDILLKHD